MLATVFQDQSALLGRAGLTSRLQIGPFGPVAEALQAKGAAGWRRFFGGKTMIRQLSTRACIAAICIFAAATAQAATLQDVSNPVKANFGDGFVPVSNGAQLQPGDSVMAQAGGSAQIVYEGGCTEPVNIDTDIVVVKAEPPCVGATTGGWGPVPVGVADWAMWTLPGAAIIGGLVFLFKDDDSGVLEIDVAASP